MTEPTKDPLANRDEIRAPLDPSRYTTLRRLVEQPDHRVVVSFGGGSVPGLCGNAALASILEELGIHEHVAEVWGTSAGAAVGGPWASGTPAAQVFENILALNRQGAIDVPWLRLAWALFLKPFGGRLPDGLIRGDNFRKAVEHALSCETFEECPMTFRCIACSDDGASRRKVFRSGPLLPAIFSSMSIPGIVIPRPRKDDEPTGYYDGGLVEKTPLISPIAEHNRRHASKKLLLIGTHFGNDARRVPARGFVMRFLSSINALEDLAWEYQLREARDRTDVQLLMLNPEVDDPRLFDFSRAEHNWLHARTFFASRLEDARIGLAFGAR